MRKTILTFLLLIIISTTLHAQKLKIIENDGTSTEYNLSDIEKIVPQNISEDYRMKIYRNGSTPVVIDLTTVDKLEYSEGNFLVYIDGSSTSYSANNIIRVVFFDLSGYETVVIGDQEWMQYNLDVAYYRNGDTIYHAESNYDWEYARDNGIGAWCYYNNSSSNGVIYGKLYNWYAVNDERGLAPEGWRVPSDDDWKELEMYLGLSQEEADDWYWRGTTEGAKLAGGYDLWYNGSLRNHSDFNSSGFSGLPGGYRDYYGFQSMSWDASWWSSTEYSSTKAIDRYLKYWHTDVGRYHEPKSYGRSVRCVMD
jgi:uncharacterized protein (TIGR02145 family)